MSWTISFQIIPNAITTSNVRHDFALMFRLEKGKLPLLDDMEDLRAFITTMQEGRDTMLSIDVAQVKYEGEVWNCVYLDLGDIKDNH